jgi:hypothetical protein
MRFANIKLKPGRIYILRNPMHKDALVKIGYTQTASEERSLQLSKATGVPYPFEVMYEEDVADCALAERLIHDALSNYRVNPNREFFQLPIKRAVRVVFEVCLKVNSALIKEKCRLSIWLNQGGLQAASELKDLLFPLRGGDTCVYLTYRNDNAEMQLRLSDSYLVHCSPSL